MIRKVVRKHVHGIVELECGHREITNRKKSKEEICYKCRVDELQTLYTDLAQAFSNINHPDRLI